MRLSGALLLVVVVSSPAISLAETKCRGTERPPFCWVDGKGNLTIEADGLAELLPNDMQEDAIQEALLIAKS